MSREDLYADGELRISVVIPTFQRREEVVRAIDSALAQTFPPTEIVVVDDGSTDGTSDAITARYGDRVRLLQQPNRGPSAARNAAIAVAMGEVVAFLDSDDLWRPHHLAVIAELFARHPTAVLVGTQRNLTPGDEVSSESRVADVAEDLLLCRVAVGLPTSVAVRREALEAVGGFAEQHRYVEDDELFLRLALHGPFSLISAATVERVRNDDSHGDEGYRTGAFTSHYEWTADRVLEVLGRCGRPDVDVLRDAARARRALGAAVRSLAGGEPAEAVRAHLVELRRWAPDVDAEASVLRAATWILPEWDVPDERRRMATTLRQAGHA